jgi:hypothetical protein
MPLPKLEALIALVVFLTPHSITTPHEVSAQTPKLIKPVSTIQEVKLPATPAKLDSVAPPAPAVTVSGCGDNFYANYIYTHESGCNTSALNSIGCYGIGQACPASKIAQCGADYACQNAWFTQYAISAYGGWAGAYNHWVNYHWW